MVGSISIVDVFPVGVTITMVSGLMVTLVVCPWLVFTDVFEGTVGSKVMTEFWAVFIGAIVALFYHFEVED